MEQETVEPARPATPTTDRMPPAPEGAGAEPLPDSSLEKDGFEVVRAESRARLLGEQFRQELKEGDVKGIKSFDGNYYFMNRERYEEAAAKMNGFFAGQQQAGLDEICAGTGLENAVARAVLEFLKEEGSLIEKRKGFYQYIE